EHVRRHAGILASAQAAVLVTVREAMAVARLLEAGVPDLRRVVTAGDLSKERGEAQGVRVTAESIAFIQYTSGSTGNPKGVVLTHANLLANIRAMARVLRATPSDVFVSWLPLYHDMGLIGAWLGSLCVGFPLVVMSPLAFLARPERWLQAIHRYRGTLSAGPNFAYELCSRKLEDAQLAGLDLSSWRLAFNGAEPVSPDTIARFQERFARFGFRPEAMAPVYGLAEASVGLLFPPLGRAPLIDRIRRQPFERNGKALPAAPTDPNPLRFVACGRPLPDHQVRIVDEIGLEAGERIEGRLQFKGPSATSGYYRNPEETRRLFSGEWLESGDRAYLAEGEVYVTGRIKDIIIRGGRNIHPHGIEDAVGVLAGVRRGCVAAFGSRDPRTGTERLVVLAETRETDAAARDALRERISGTVLDVLGEPPDEVVLAPAHTALKTSSGKIRRSATRALYEAGAIGAGRRAAWWQVLRLSARAALPQARRWLRAGGEVAYAAYAWLVFWVVAPPTWLLTAATRRPADAWAFGGAAARLFLKLCRIPLVVRGLENLPAGAPSVLVANHASYLDGIILVAALPRHYSFVAKRELDGKFISSVYLRRLGAEFVERFVAQQGAEDGQRMVSAVAAGRSLAFFPEGTFRRAPGLLPFRLGAFVAAASGRLPIVPVAIRGSRGVLRGDGWFLRPGALVVTVGKPIVPPAGAPDPFALAVELRDAARAEILAHCGEADAG
ncbi:MAG TPA: AMP-binding protein, partial [Burkholderiales bacterium]